MSNNPLNNPKYERVNLDSMPTDPLKHTGLKQGGSLPHPSQVGASADEAQDGGDFDVNAYARMAQASSGFNPQISVPASAPQQATIPTQEQRTVTYQPVDSAGVRLSSQESDVLSRMREKFGVSRAPLLFKEIDEFKFGFRKRRGVVETAWAFQKLSEVQAAKGEELTELEQAWMTQLIFASAHLATLNDVPLYKHFGVDVSGVRDPHNPPADIRTLVADLAYELLTDMGEEDFLRPLFAFFGEQILSKASSDEAHGGGPLEQAAP